jgi:hypothetical protein
MSARDNRDTHELLARCMADACRQGRIKCPVPQACVRSEPMFDRSPVASFAIASALVVACVVVALILSGVWQ